MRFGKSVLHTLLVTLSVVLCFAVWPRTAAVVEGSTASLYVVPTMTDDHILPTTTISSQYLSSQISITACPGEFEPASFVVRAGDRISTLTAAATDLSGPSGSIPASCVDIKYVKCWWQAKPATTKPYARVDTTSRVLLPELLLNDPNLIRADQNQQNYIKLTNGTYKCISQNTITTVNEYPKVSQMPVRDSSTLLPVDIPAGSNQQYWVTMEVPAQANAGTYNGAITLTTPSGQIGTLAVALTVLPFSLQPSFLHHTVHNWMDLVTDSYATLGPQKSEQQVKAELRDIYEHGGVPCITENWGSDLRKVFQWMRDIGYTTKTVYYYGLAGLMSIANSDATRLARLKSQVQGVVSLAAEYGFTEVYIYGVDEAPASRRYLERPNYQTVHSAGAKVFVCSYTGTFEAVGDILDTVVWPATPDTTEAAKWHSVGHKILCYLNPQSGVEAPASYRRNFGLLLWQKNYDGGLSFSYQWVDGGLLWSDFSGRFYRSEVFAFPTMNGVVDTIEWEGWREGADDVRYLATLLKTIKDAKANGKNTSAAEAWLAQLKSSTLATSDLGAVRSTMIDYILSLSSTSSPGNTDVTPPVISSVASSVVSSPAVSATITWNTNEGATTQVEYGKSSQLGLASVLDTNLLSNHSVTLSSLDPNTTYYFKVKSADASGNPAASSVQTFSTSATAPSGSSGLIAYLSLNEGTGTVAYDRSTYANNGTLKNGTQWTTGKSGSALSLDGVDDYIDCGRQSSLDTTTVFTITAWVKTSKVGWNAMVRKLVNPSNGYWFGTNSYGYLYMLLYNNGTSRVCTTNVYLADGAWHHVVGVYDGTTTTFYVDGKTVYSKNWGSYMAVGSTAGSSLYISSVGSDRFKGVIDEVGIWNRALSADEATACYASGIRAASLVAGAQVDSDAIDAPALDSLGEPNEAIADEQTTNTAPDSLDLTTASDLPDDTTTDTSDASLMLPTVVLTDSEQPVQGNTQTVVIAGMAVGDASDVSFGPGVTVESVTADSPDQITIVVTVASDAEIGDRDITVVTPHGSQTLSGFFTVAQAPSVQEPNNGFPSWAWVVVVLGMMALASVTSVVLRRRSVLARQAQSEPDGQ